MRFVLATPSPGKSQLAVHAAFPENEQNDLSRTLVDIHDDFVDERPDGAFATSRIGVGPE